MNIRFEKIPRPFGGICTSLPTYLPVAAETGEPSAAAGSRSAAAGSADVSIRDPFERSEFFQSVLDGLAMSFGFLFGLLLAATVIAAVIGPFLLAL